MNLLHYLYDFFNPKQEEKETMLNFVLPMVANMLRDMVVDKAQSLASSHLEEHLNKLPKEAREALDDAVNGDDSHGHKNLIDLIKS